MEYIHVRNLEKYHPGYKDRTLQWAKIYFRMAQGDPDCDMIMNELDWGRLVKIILLELQAKQPLPNNDEYWTRKGFDIKTRKMSLTLQMLQNFVVVCNNPLRNGYTDIYKEDIYKQDKEKDIPSNKLPEGSFTRVKELYIKEYKEWFKIDPLINKADVFCLQAMIRKYGEKELDAELFKGYFRNKMQDNWREKNHYNLSALKKAMELKVFNDSRRDK
jgi:hypothetical protein